MQLPNPKRAKKRGAEAARRQESAMKSRPFFSCSSTAIRFERLAAAFVLSLLFCAMAATAQMPGMAEAGAGKTKDAKTSADERKQPEQSRTTAAVATVGACANFTGSAAHAPADRRSANAVNAAEATNLIQYPPRPT